MNIKQITNYGHIQIFENATTYSAITVFNKKKNNNILYQKAIQKDKFEEMLINVEDLKEKKIWQFSNDNKNRKQKNILKLNDICEIHVGISTLMDKAYIFSIEVVDEKYVKAYTKLRGTVLIEKNILKPIIKGSKLKSSKDPIKEYILFPYQKINGKYRIIDENELRKEYPNAYNYLLSIKEELSKRDNGKPIVPWYGFGRTQSLDTSFGKKIIFAPMNKEPNFILYENEECTIYSGYFIKYEGDYECLLKILNSKKMKDYIENSSRSFKNGWKAYNKKVLEEFIIEE